MDIIRFISTDHIRFQNGKDVSGHQYGNQRGIEIKKQSGSDYYIVTIYNFSNGHPIWGNNIQMAPKIMKIISDSPSQIEFRGFGTDITGAEYSDYGITLYFKDKEIDKAVLHLLDRGIDIEYYK